MRFTIILALLSFSTCACSQPKTERPVEQPVADKDKISDDGASTDCEDCIWISGTPVFTFGEGYMTLLPMADAADGPWTDSGEVQLGEHKLAQGQVHQVRLTKVERDPGIQDVGAWYYQVDEVLQSKPGGPPVDVYPGIGMNGLMLESFSGSGDDDWGPFHIVRGPDATISVALADVGQVQIGEHTIVAGTEVAEIVNTIGGCTEEVVIGGLVFRCNGVTVTVPGPTGAPEAVELMVHKASP